MAKTICTTTHTLDGEDGENGNFLNVVYTAFGLVWPNPLIHSRSHAV